MEMLIFSHSKVMYLTLLDNQVSMNVTKHWERFSRTKDIELLSTRPPKKTRSEKPVVIAKSLSLFSSGQFAPDHARLI